MNTATIDAFEPNLQRGTAGLTNEQLLAVVISRLEAALHRDPDCRHTTNAWTKACETEMWLQRLAREKAGG
jgi:hypothetical protein